MIWMCCLLLQLGMFTHHSPLVFCCMESEMAMFRGAALGRCRSWRIVIFLPFEVMKLQGFLEQPTWETGVHWQTQNFIINHQSCEWFIVAKSQEACEKKLFVVAACPRFAMIVRERTLVTFNKNIIYKWTMKKTYVDWLKKGNYIYCSYKRLVGWDSNVFFLCVLTFFLTGYGDPRFLLTLVEVGGHH